MLDQNLVEKMTAVLQKHCGGKVSMNSDILIIIPAYNEAVNITRVVDQLQQEYSQYDYVIVNDGSRDDTEKLCRKKKYNVLNLPINLGIGGAVQTGYRYALRCGYQMAVQLDGDGQHDPAYIEDILRPIREGEADIVIGSRFEEKQGFQSSASRRMGIRILSSLIRLCAGKRVKDVTSGFRAINREFIKIYSEDYPTDYPEPEAIITAIMYGGKVQEVPVKMRERQGGESSITLYKSVYYMIKVTLAILVKRLSYGIRRNK